jgi:hypothetical protein
VPEPLHCSLAVYNSAGEVVRLLYNGTAQAGTTGITLLPGLQVDPSTGALAFGIEGLLTAAGGTRYWPMDNNGGQRVGGGIYYITLALTDPYGNTKTQSLAVEVMPLDQESSLEVYNSAGELVRKIALDNLSGPPSDLLLSDGAAFVGASPQAGPTAGLRLDLKVGGATQPAYWDGNNGAGQPVSPGTYLIKLVTGVPGQRNTVKTISVTLLQTPELAAQAAAASAVFAPNPIVPGASSIQLRYAPAPGLSGQVRLYNLAGELIASGVDDGGTGLIILPLQVSGGVYVADFGIVGSSGARLARRALKLAVVR